VDPIEGARGEHGTLHAAERFEIGVDLHAAGAKVGIGTQDAGAGAGAGWIIATAPAYWRTTSPHPFASSASSSETMIACLGVVAASYSA